MKTIGLIGGMTWHSTIEYYRLINAGVQKKLGGSHSARCILYSVDFYGIERLQNAGEWEELANQMAEAALCLERAGADLLVICANTMHWAAPAVEKVIHIPLLHIADAAADEVRKQGMEAVGLLGTSFTMEKEFYRERLEKQHGLEVLIPGADERKAIHDIIYQELGMGILNDSSRKIYQAVIHNLHSRGAEGVILGCTEIPLLIRQADSPIPLFDTTALHAAAAVERALPN